MYISLVDLCPHPLSKDYLALYLFIKLNLINVIFLIKIERWSHVGVIEGEAACFCRRLFE